MLRAATLPRTPKHRIYSAATDAAGLWSALFDPPFAVAPHVAVTLIGADENTQFRLALANASGFTVHVFRRTVINVLGLQVPSFAVENVAGQICEALVTEVL